MARYQQAALQDQLQARGQPEYLLIDLLTHFKMMNRFRFQILSQLSLLALLTFLSPPLFAGTSYVFRIHAVESATATTNTLERRSTTDTSWTVVSTQISASLVVLDWATYDQNNPDILCFRYFVNTIMGSGYPVLQCSMDSGKNWAIFWETTPEQSYYDLRGNFIRSIRKISGNQILISTTDNDYHATLTSLPDFSSNGGTLVIEKLSSNKVPACKADATSSKCIHQIMTGRPRVWYDPFQPGQGFTLTEVSGGYWGYFTSYDAYGSSSWWLATPYGGLHALNLGLFSGPSLSNSWDMSRISSRFVGIGNTTYQGPTQMRLEVDFGYYWDAFRHDPILERRFLTLVPFDAPSIATDTPDCGSVPTNRLCADAYLNGWPRVWYDPAQSGQGFTLTAVNGAFWGYYTAYNDNGSAAWWLFTSAGPNVGSNQFSFELHEYSGPGIGSIWDINKLNSRVAGTGQLIMYGPDRMTLDIQLGSTQRRLALVPFDTP